MSVIPSPLKSPNVVTLGEVHQLGLHELHVTPDAVSFVIPTFVAPVLLFRHRKSVLPSPLKSPVESQSFVPPQYDPQGLNVKAVPLERPTLIAPDPHSTWQYTSCRPSRLKSPVPKVFVHASPQLPPPVKLWSEASVR